MTWLANNLWKAILLLSLSFSLSIFIIIMFLFQSLLVIFHADFNVGFVN